MKLKEGMSIVVGKKTYRGEIPDNVVANIIAGCGDSKEHIAEVKKRVALWKKVEEKPAEESKK